MSRVYISGPITGVKDYLRDFGEAERILEAHDYEVVNPAKVMSHLPESFTWDEYMKVAFAMLDCCDTIYMMPNWEQSKGAIQEFIRSQKMGLTLLTSKDSWEES